MAGPISVVAALGAAIVAVSATHGLSSTASPSRRAPALHVVARPAPVGASVGLTVAGLGRLGGGERSCAVDWGDASATLGAVHGDVCTARHGYRTAGGYRVVVTARARSGQVARGRTTLAVDGPPAPVETLRLRAPGAVLVRPGWHDERSATWGPPGAAPAPIVIAGVPRSAGPARHRPCDP